MGLYFVKGQGNLAVNLANSWKVDVILNVTDWSVKAWFVSISTPEVLFTGTQALAAAFARDMFANPLGVVTNQPAWHVKGSSNLAVNLSNAWKLDVVSNGVNFDLKAFLLNPLGTVLPEILFTGTQVACAAFAVAMFQNPLGIV